MTWSEATLLDAAFASLDAEMPVYMLRQVEMADRRIDAVALLGAKRIGIEAKTSRADFRNESDAKRDPTWQATHLCVYLCPPGIIEPRDLPPGWGLWYATGPASVRTVVPGEWHDPHPAAVSAYATLLTRRAAAVERRVRAAERVSDPVASLVAVDEEVQRLEGLLAQQAAAVAREKARAQDAAEQVAAIVGGQVCSCCEQPIVYTRVGKWRHENRVHDTECEARRAEAERLRRQDLTGAEYVAVRAPRIVPASVPTDC